MKTLITKTLMLAVAVFGMSACQQNSSGSKKATTIAQQYNCINCQAVVSGYPLLTAVQAATPDGAVLFSLDLRGQISQPCYQQPDKYVICAAGAASMVGYMRVQQAGYICGSPAGDYTVRPIQASMITNTVLFGGAFEAVGPGNFRIRFHMDKGVFYNDDGYGLRYSSANNRVGMGLVIDSANGYSCGTLSTD